MESAGRAERAVLITTEQQILLDTVGPYTGSWRDRAVLDLVLTDETRIRRQRRATHERFAVGGVARTDVVGFPPGVLAEPEPLGEPRL